MLSRGLIAAVLIGVIGFLVPCAAQADSNVSDPGALFPLTPNAQGTRVSGQLAIYYDVIDNPVLSKRTGQTKCAIDNVNMFFVLRLQRNNGAPLGFASSLKDVCYELSQPQVDAVMNFVGTIIGNFVPSATTFALTSVSNIVQDGQAPTNIAPPYFFMMDVEFKAQ
jgi:hypothetical protein